MGDVRRVGVLTSGHGLEAGDHICWSFSNDDEQRAVLSAFYAEGVERGERLVYFAPEHLHAQLRAALGSDMVDDLIADGRLTMISCGQMANPDGSLDEGFLIDTWEAFAAESVAAGYPGLRAAGHACSLRDRAWSDRQIARYEFRADLLAARLPLTALCCYDERVLDARSIALARSVHPLVLAKGDTRDAGFTMICTAPGEVTLAGEVDVLHATTVEAALHAAGGDLRTLDLSDLRFADVTAVRAVAGAIGAIAARGNPPVIRGAPALFRRIWDLLALPEPVGGTFEP